MKKIGNYILYLFVFIFIYFLLIKPLIVDKILLFTNYKFVHGKIIRKESSVNGGPDYIVLYIVDGKKYTRFFSQNSNYKVKIGDCFLIEYYPPNPKNSHILLDEPVECDSVLNR